MARFTTSSFVKGGPPAGSAPSPSSMSSMGMDSSAVAERIRKGSAVNATIMAADRPSNFWYSAQQQPFWTWYALMDWYRSEVSVFSTIILRSTTELFRHGIDFVPKFSRKCVDCGFESQTVVAECPICHSRKLREPDPLQKDYFKRPDGTSFIDEANDNQQSLVDVLKAYGEMQYQNNQAYMLCVTGDIVDADTGKLLRAYPLEFVSIDPKFVKYLYDESGKPGLKYGFVRKDRHELITLDEDDPEEADEEGQEIYPAYWQIGNNYGGTGDCWCYTKEEVYQDHWFRQALTYGMPIWYDIEDDLLTYHFIEKHNLKLYKYGYLRKIIILPGFNDEDVEDITKGIQDVLATNDNSIPIVCTPPQIPGTAEMKAQTLELGAESANDLMQIKNDIRDRICAHGGVPNLFAGDVEASGGMNNESQQITVYDRYLMDKYNYTDRLLAWVMSWFPQITDWKLEICRPSKAYTDTKRRMDRLQEAQMMKGLGFEIYYENGEFRYSQEPVDQADRRRQQEQQEAMAKSGALESQGPAEGDRGMLPGDGDGPPERGSARREDEGIADGKDQVDLAMREADGSLEG